MNNAIINFRCMNQAAAKAGAFDGADSPRLRRTLQCSVCCNPVWNRRLNLHRNERMNHRGGGFGVGVGSGYGGTACEVCIARAAAQKPTEV